MISRPSTDQVLLDCCTELLDQVLPLIDDEMTAARITMLEGVLRSAAVRAAHEIALMQEETAAMLAYARTVESGSSSVATSGPGSTATTEPVSGDSLHLADVTERYCRAGEAFSRALEAVGDSDERLREEGVRILEQRVEHERLARGMWSSAAGR